MLFKPKRPALWLPSRRALLTGATALAAYGALREPAFATIGTPTSLGSATSTTTGISNFTLTTTADITAGNLVGVLVGLVNFSSTVTVSSISDGTNSYSHNLSATEVDSISHFDLEFWSISNAAHVNSGATLTITLSAPASGTLFSGAAVMLQLPGIATSAAYDSAGATNSDFASTAATVTTGTLAQSNEIVFGGNFNNVNSAAQVYSEDPAFTNLFDEIGTGNMGINLGYKIVSSTTPVTHAPTWSTSADYIELAAPFKGASSGAAATPQRTLLGVGQ